MIAEKVGADALVAVIRPVERNAGILSDTVSHTVDAPVRPLMSQTYVAITISSLF